MSEGTKVTIYAAPKVLQDMIEELYDTIAAGGSELDPMIGGPDIDHPTTISSGPNNQVKWAKASPGWFDYGMGPQELLPGNNWIFWWNKLIWKPIDLGPLPIQDIGPLESAINNLKVTTESLEKNQNSLNTSEYDLLKFVDDNGRAFGKFNENSGLELTDLEGSVQDSLKRIPDGIFRGKDSDLLINADNEGNAFQRFDEDSHEFLVGLEGSVQDNINETKMRIFGMEVNSEIEPLVVDDDKNILVAMSESAGFLLVGLDKSVQDEINEIKRGSPLNARIDLSKIQDLSPESKEIIFRRTLNGLPSASVPSGVLPQNWIFNTSNIPGLSAPLATSYVQIGMKNGVVFNSDSGVVHPNIVEFDIPVCGYKYWMTLNGYPHESWEITWLYGTNNPEFTEWQLIEGVPQPFEDNPVLVPPYISSHDSDSFITYDPLRGEIIVAWRRTMRWHPTAANGQTNEYRYRSSTNGKVWSEVKQLIRPVTADIDLMQSASMVFNPVDRMFYMFDVAPVGSLGWKIKWKTNTDIADPDGWSEEQFIEPPAGVKPWHLDARFIGGSIVILLHENQNVSPGQDRLWFCASDNMQDWTWSTNDVLGGTTPLYKATFIPIDNGDGTMKFRIAYTTDERAEVGDQWKLKITDTNSFNI